MEGKGKGQAVERTPAEKKAAKEAFRARLAAEVAENIERTGVQKPVMIKTKEGKDLISLGRVKSIGKKKPVSKKQQSDEDSETEEETPELITRESRPKVKSARSSEPIVEKVATPVSDKATKTSEAAAKLDERAQKIRKVPVSTDRDSEVVEPASKKARGVAPEAESIPESQSELPEQAGPAPQNTGAAASQSSTVREMGKTYVRRQRIKRKALPFQSLHNQIACLDTRMVGIDRCPQMMEFLIKSRIYKAISADPKVYENQMEDFWRTANYDESSKSVFAKVHGIDVEITEADVRRVLEFKDAPNDPVNPLKEKVRLCLLKCGFPDPTQVIKKKLFCAPFKYLTHVLMLCLSDRKAGIDTMSEEMSKVFASLIMNMPFNISKMIWNNIVDAAKSDKLTFLLYPRFIQMILDDKQYNIPKSGSLIAIYKMGAATMGHIVSFKGNLAEKPKDVEFWGAMVDPAYVCPPDSDFLQALDVDDMEVEIIQPPPQATKRKQKTADAAAHVDMVSRVMDVGTKKRHPALLVKPKAGTSSGSTHPRATQPSESSSTSPALLELTARMDKRDEEHAQEKALLEKRVASLERKAARERSKRKSVQQENRNLKKRLVIVERNLERIPKKMRVDSAGVYKWHKLVSEENQYSTDSESSSEEEQMESEPEPETESEAEKEGTNTAAT